MADIVSTDDVLGGAPRIEGRRIGVHHVAARVLDAGTPPEQVATDYDLELGDIYRALAYYYDNPDEIREVRARRREPPDTRGIVRGPEDLESEDRPTREA